MPKEVPIASQPVAVEEGFEEVTLADIVRVLYRRKIILGGVFLLILLAGIGITAFTTPQYESKASIVPLEHPDIIKNWLDSRHAGELVVLALGTRVEQRLMASEWDAGTQNWKGTPPTLEEKGRALAGHVTVTQSAARLGGVADRLITVTVEFPDPLIARDVAAAYVDTLERLRPNLENITRQEAFDKYYDGSNEQAAQQRAEVTARQKQYWLELDAASLPEDPSKPNKVLNISLSVVLGLLLGIFAVFLVEWVSRYRADRRALGVPETPGSEKAGAPPPPSSSEPSAGFGESAFRRRR